MYQVRQGDVLIDSIRKSTIPKDAVRKEGRIILALGEATGHHHEVEVMEPETVELYEHDGLTYVRVKKSSDLTHQEHGPHTLMPGDYAVELQREYYDGLIRQVVD